MAATIDDRVHALPGPNRAVPGSVSSSRGTVYGGLAESETRFWQGVDTFRSGDRVMVCGSIPVAAQLADRGVSVVFVDADVDVVDAARVELSSAEAVEYRVGAVEALDLPDSSLEGVVGIGFLQRSDIAACVAMFARALSPNGRVVMIEPLGHNIAINLHRRRTPADRRALDHPLRWEDFGLAQRFFDTVEVETFHLFAIVTSPIAHRWWGRPLHALMARLDRAVLGASERLRWQAWIAVAEFRDPT